MQKQKQENVFGARLITAVLLAVLAVGRLSAAGEKKIEGTVKSIGSDLVTVQTADQKLQTVKIGSKTKFLKHNKPSSLNEMKPGDHVVFRVKPMSSTAQAENATTETNNTNSSDCSGATTSTVTTSSGSSHKDTLQLGLSFCAVQASY